MEELLNGFGAKRGAQPVFRYDNDSLHCEEVDLGRIASEVGTPVYVYSRGAIETAVHRFAAALSPLRHHICYSVKANPNLAVLAVLARLGAGADIVSGGELYRWRLAGGDPAKVVFSGVGKTRTEVEDALAAGIRMFNVESEEELEVVAAAGVAAARRAPVAFRVNPDVDAQTHPYISTGLRQNKFGIPTEQALALYRRHAGRPGIELCGIDCHIGSQLTKTSPFSDALARVVALADEVLAAGAPLRYVDIGGGLGIHYGQEDAPAPPSFEDYGAAVQAALAPLSARGIEIICEPGRSLVGQAGVLLTHVLYNKDNEGKHFTIVNAAMNDLMRPALYGAYHPIAPVRRDATRAERVTDVVGPICETGDFFARDRRLPVLERGELVAIGAAGAYGASMSSNYNTRPRGAEVMVAGDRYWIVRTHETLAQLVANERLVEEP